MPFALTGPSPIQVDEGEPGLEGTRYTGNLVLNRQPLQGGNRMHYYVDERVRREMLEFRKGLPAYKRWPEMKAALRDNRVSVVMGETGSGKTTQVPPPHYARLPPSLC